MASHTPHSHIYVEVLSQSQWGPKIHDYGIIGDCRAAALISTSGSIDWLCWPRFDSPAIFAALLDRERGGSWSISPTQPYTAEHHYIPGTNVLQTEFSCPTGSAILTDLMPVASEEFERSALVPDHELVRQVECTRGDIEFSVDFRPRSEYGKYAVRICPLNPLGIRMDVGRGAYWLRSGVPFRIQADRASAGIHLHRGNVVQFSLTYAEESPAVLPALGARISEAIQRSIDWWQQWDANNSYCGPYRDAVSRSALTLKLLTYAPSGAIVAAATTSLPEILGGPLNWDYRYCWLRDASLTTRALLGLGYVDEAESFITWMLHATRLTHPRLRILYTVFGEIAPSERTLDHLSGYFNSRPVRIGNDARNQLQLDVYGEVIDAAGQYVASGRTLDRTTQKVLIGFGKYVTQTWDLPDEGLWEPRTGRTNHTYSRLLCWSALQRLLWLCDNNRLRGAPRNLFAREMQRIATQIRTRAWNEQLQSYVSQLDGDALDATLLRIPWYGFEPANSSRMKNTCRAIRDRLGAGDGLLYRYERQPAEGAFGICSFWAVEYLALGGGTLREAHELFEILLHLRNPLGLFAEEIEPHTGDALGNFPQAFTHLGLISAALSLEERKQREQEGRPHVRYGVQSV